MFACPCQQSKVKLLRHPPQQQKPKLLSDLLPDLDRLDDSGVSLLNCNLDYVDPVLHRVQVLEPIRDVNLRVQRPAAVAGTLPLMNHLSIGIEQPVAQSDAPVAQSDALTNMC